MVEMTEVERSPEYQRVREEIAGEEHEQWIRWATSLLPELEELTKQHKSIMTYPDNYCSCPTCLRIKRWRLLLYPYSMLDESEKELDRKEADQILSIKGIAILEDGYLPVEPVQLEVLTPEEIITTLHWREAWVKAKSIHLRRLMKATNARNEAKFGKLYRRKE